MKGVFITVLYVFKMLYKIWISQSPTTMQQISCLKYLTLYLSSIPRPPRHFRRKISQQWPPARMVNPNPKDLSISRSYSCNINNLPLGTRLSLRDIILFAYARNTLTSVVAIRLCCRCHVPRTLAQFPYPLTICRWHVEEGGSSARPRFGTVYFGGTCSVRDLICLLMHFRVREKV